MKWYMNNEPTSYSESIEFVRRGIFHRMRWQFWWDVTGHGRVLPAASSRDNDQRTLGFCTLDFHTLKVVEVGQAVHFITDLVGQSGMRGEAPAFLYHEKNCLKCPTDRPWPATYLSISIQVQASFVMVNWARNFLSNRSGIQLQRVGKRLWRHWTWSMERMP